MASGLVCSCFRALLIAALTVTEAFAFESTDYFPLVVGRQWNYASDGPQDDYRLKVTGTRTVNGRQTFILDDISEFYLRGDPCIYAPVYYTNDAQGLRCHGHDTTGGLRTIRPPVVLLPAHFDIGTVTRMSGKVGDFDYTTTINIESETFINVPLGRFRTIEVSIETVEHLSFNYDYKGKYWFAEGLGPVRIRDSEGYVYELVSIAGFPDENNDGIQDILAHDDDGDGVRDEDDAFPLDPDEWADSDKDGTGDNADNDDDNDGMPDTYEEQYGLDVFDATDAAMDNDGDGFSNLEEFREGRNPLVNEEVMLQLLILISE